MHWIEPITLERNSQALACRRMIGHHSYDNIAEYIDKVLNEFNKQNKTTLVVTDNASNFVKAFRCVYCYFLRLFTFKKKYLHNWYIVVLY